jgi:hypothetical protein
MGGQPNTVKEKIRLQSSQNKQNFGFNQRVLFRTFNTYSTAIFALTAGR